MNEPDTTAVLSELEARRKKDRTVGLVILLVAFLIGLGLSLWAKAKSRPEVALPPGPPSTAGIVGFPSAVEVLKSVAAARAATKRPLLRGIWAEGVKANGVVDVSDGSGRARFVFQSAEGHGAQPSREPGTLPRRHYCGKQTVHIKKEGVVADPDVTDYPCPAQHFDALPEPRCGFLEVWKYAETQGAPTNRQARIEYYRSRTGPAWRFEIPGTTYRFALYGDCGRVLEESDAVAIPP